MEIQELLANVSYVTNQGGKRQAVMLDLSIWEALLAQLEEIGSKDVESTHDEAMAREERAYRMLHPELLKTHFGQQVAIYEGKLVDYDDDAEALYLRVRKAYPGEFVLITPVLPTAEETYVIRSPRLAPYSAG